MRGLRRSMGDSPRGAYAITQELEDTPDVPTIVEITFDQGIPTALDGETLNLAELIMKMNRLAGEHGIGRIDHIENRLVGIKSREVYECPGAMALMTAHKELEDLVLFASWPISNQSSSSNWPK